MDLLDFIEDDTPPPPPIKSRYKVGDRVRGYTCLGSPFSGTVSGILSSATIYIDGVATPVSLLTEESE